MIRKDYKALASSPGTVGIEIVLSIALPFFLGRWLDQRFGTDPTIQIIGFFLGCATAVKAIHRTWKEMQRKAEEEEAIEGKQGRLRIEEDEPEDKRDDKKH